MKYDLEERTSAFGEKIIIFIRSLPLDEVTRPLINQLIRSGTSIGANYCEANESCSKKDFRNKIFISKKESGETKHWLRNKANEARILWREAHEYTLIFSKIIHKMNSAQ